MQAFFNLFFDSQATLPGPPLDLENDFLDRNGVSATFRKFHGHGFVLSPIH